ncbi:MAG: aryl-sulfate sulfotransferase [Bdellovibrionales bacterium]|nr:aryl-sulfate sulfotransferase [Bdellovibrionales bacterium]
MKRVLEVIVLLVAILFLGYATRQYVYQNGLKERGVFLFRPTSVSEGVNLYASTRTPVALLVDNEGKVLHKWNGKNHSGRGWHNVELTSSGDLFAITTDVAIEKLDAKSEVVWRVNGGFHHDLDIDQKGDIVALSRREEKVTYSKGTIRILNDYISFINADGKIETELSVYSIAKHLVPVDRINLAIEWVDKVQPNVIENDTPGEIFHTNSIEFIRQEIPGFAKAGDLLLCFRDLDRVVVIDPVSRKLVWEWGDGQLDRPHHPTLLKNGNLLIFDNGERRGYSRVIELDPRTNKIDWEYLGDPPESFFSFKRGGSQRLQNGNTLITLGEPGIVMEVTPAKEIVWEFRNPMGFWSGKGRDKVWQRDTIYRMTRVPDSFLDALR